MVYPLVNIVVVQGGLKACRKFKRLMLERIDWNLPDSTASPISAAGGNSCTLVWDGVIPNRTFRGFYTHFIQTEAKARELFEAAGVIEYWNAARLNKSL